MKTSKNPASMPQNAVIIKLDVIFKKLFSEHLDLLHELLSGLLSLPKESIKNLKLRNTEMLPDSINGKFVRMDLIMEVDGKLINVEMQYGNDPYYKDRTLLYWAKLYGGELQSGDDYGELKQCICINIVNHPIFKCSEFHSCFTVTEKTRCEELTDKCAIHFFELSKTSKTINKDNPAELWLQLINAETEEEFRMLEETGVAPIQKAVYIVHEMSEDEKIQEMARIREKARCVEITALNDAERRGREQGRKKERIAIARKLLKLGRPAEEISEATGLSVEEIAQLTKASGTNSCAG